ncbi:MAG: helix-turn-helix transcriptional regulator [Clostridia bacterium]|nr:helix-turn-helix transcriptional regulator [Clostridia bacterium]
MDTIFQSQMEETKKHGDILFPFNIYPCTIPKDFPGVSLHWHRNMEFIFVKKGKMLCQLDMTTETVSGGDICIVPPGTLHGMYTIDSLSCEYENIIFDPEMLGAGAADLCARQYLTPLSAGRLLTPTFYRPDDEGYKSLYAILSETEKLCEYKPGAYELAVKGAMLQLIYHLFALSPKTAVTENPGTARLKSVLEYIRKEHAHAITVQEIANVASCSPSHFMRWFKQMTNSSFTAYLNEHRLSEAARKLRMSDDKILTIAEDTGFESLSNFNHQFKMRYGVTPREYRSGK